MNCRACGRELPSDARFCLQCGAPQEHRTRVDTAHRSDVFSTPRGEERLVTVVFADLTESVKRTATLSPEQATELVNPLLEAMVELMVRHGGRIDRFLGDGVLAVFGVPVAHEDDPIRAVRAAMDLRERAMSLGVSVTVGVNTGRVYFGPVGSALHEELTVMGSVVNLAARLQGAADADQILLGESTRSHVEASFQLRPVTMSIKGLDGEVTAYRAESLVDHPDKVRGIEGLNADLVGRDHELGLLRKATRDPESSIHALVGPAGMGKSRLLSELNREVVGGGFVWLEGRCLDLTSHVQYGPFLDMLRRLWGPGDTNRALRASLDEMVIEGALTGENADDIAPFLAALFDGEAGSVPNEVTAASPDQRRSLTMDALVTYLLAQAVNRPAVMVVEDLHWSDDSSIEVLRHLHQRTRNGASSGLVVVSYRPDDEDSPISELEEQMTILRLGELTTVEASSLVERLLDGELPAEMEKRIAENAGGNPFYVEEIIRTLIQRGVVERVEGRWMTVASVEEIPVPESVEGVIMSRFDRLPVRVKAAARLASVWDDAFTSSDLVAMAGDQAVAGAPEMIESGLTRIDREADDRRYTFVHALTRQAIYGSLLPSHRAELHERAGDILKARVPVDAGRLAHHYGHSRNHDEAVEWMYEAGRRATESYANETALDTLDRGLARIDMLATDHQPRWRGRYRALRGELLERRAEHGRAREDLQAGLDAFDDQPTELARNWSLVGQTHRLEDEFEKADVCYDRAEEAIAGLVGEDDADGWRAWIDIQAERARALYFSGRGEELSARLARLGPVVETHGTPTQVFDYLRAQILREFNQKRWVLDDESVGQARKALDVAASGLDPGRVAEGHFVLGFSLLWADRVEEAADALERAVARTARVGDVIHECRARAYHAVALRRTGNVEAAEAAARSGLDIAMGIGDGYYQGHAHAVLCWVELQQGSGRCAEVGEEAFRAWDWRSSDGHTGLGTEFVWLAAFPLAADASGRGEPETAARHLSHLLVPWERPLAADLRPLVERAAAGDHIAIEESLESARRHRLL